jgi:hypothetical protein
LTDDTLSNEGIASQLEIVFFGPARKSADSRTLLEGR